MSERPKTHFPREAPHDIYEMGGLAYCALGNGHVYEFDDNGKAHVISRDDYDKKHGLSKSPKRPKRPKNRGETPETPESVPSALAVVPETSTAIAVIPDIPKALDIVPEVQTTIATIPQTPAALAVIPEILNGNVLAPEDIRAVPAVTGADPAHEDGQTSPNKNELGLNADDLAFVLLAGEAQQAQRDGREEDQREIEARLWGEEWPEVLKRHTPDWSPERALEIKKRIEDLINDRGVATEPTPSDVTEEDDSRTIEPEPIEVPNSGADTDSAVRDDDRSDNTTIGDSAIPAAVDGSEPGGGVGDGKEDHDDPTAGGADTDEPVGTGEESIPVAAPEDLSAAGAHVPSIVGPVPPLIMASSGPSEEYEDAWNRYVKAHARARSDVLGAFAGGIAGRFGWLQKGFDKFGEKFHTRAYERQQAEKEFNSLYLEDQKARLDSEEALGWITSPEERKERRLKLEEDKAKLLQLDISELRRRAEDERGLVSRKAGVALGLGAAAVFGAAAAIYDRATKGSHGDAPMIGALTAGGLAGLVAANRSRSENEADITARIHYARESVRLNSDEAEGKALAVIATEAVTEAAQANRLGWYILTTALGVGVAGGSYEATSGVWGWAAGHMNNASPPANHSAGETPTPVPAHETATATATAPAPTPTATPTHEVVAQAPTHEVSTPAAVAATPASTGGEVARSTPVADSDTTFALKQIHQAASNTAGEVADKAVTAVNPAGSSGVISPRGGATSPSGGDMILNIITEGQEKASHVFTTVGNVAHRVQHTVAQAGKHVLEVLQSIVVPKEQGFTKIFQEQANKFGYDLSASQSYDLYHYMIDKFGPNHILINGNAFLMPNGDWGIKCAGPTQWAPGVEEALIKWFQSHLAVGV